MSEGDLSDDEVVGFANQGTAFAICLIIEVIAGSIAIWDMHRRKNINGALRALFCLSIFMSWATATGFLLWSVMELHTPNILAFNTTMNSITWIFFQLNFICIFVTLVWRTHVTFKGTKWEMSWIRKVMFMAMLCGLIVLSSVKMCLLFSIKSMHGPQYDDYFKLLIILSFIWFAMYLSSALLAVYAFQSNLVELVKTQRNSVLDSHDITQKIELSHRQQSLIALASKYIWLFAIASISSFIVLAIIFDRYELMSHSVLCMVTSFYVITDQIINALCLWLQFAFTEKIYRRVWRYPDLCCQRCIGWRLRRWQRRNQKTTFEVKSRTNSFDTQASPSPISPSPEPDQATSPASLDLEPASSMEFAVLDRGSDLQATASISEKPMNQKQQNITMIVEQDGEQEGNCES